MARITCVLGRFRPMLKVQPKGTAAWLSLAWALAGVPIAFGAFVFSAYRIALHSSSLPFDRPPGEALWFAAFLSLLLTGLAAIIYASFGTLRFRLLVYAVYAIAMSATLLFVGLWGACANGDCL